MQEIKEGELKNGKKPHGKPRHKWDDTKMFHKEVLYEDMYWIHLTQELIRYVVNTVTNLLGPRTADLC
jgi:hypothetical protein